MNLATRTFTQQDLQHFADISGDWNPIHVDPIAARRLLAGSTVVHGMLSLLWALDQHFAQGGTTPGQITAFFQRPLLPGETLQLHRTQTEDGATRLSIQRDNEETASILLRGVAQPVTARLSAHAPEHKWPESHHFADFKNKSGITQVTLAPHSLPHAFRHACQQLGVLPVAAIMALSKLVGMECPGLHSLYTGLDMQLDVIHIQPQLQWQVTRHTLQLAPIRMQVEGGGIVAKVDAFVRPEPVAQPGMNETAQGIAPGQFKNQQALIIGGSRGLGELVAKIIAAGGGQSIITYRSGRADAERVVQEITNWGGKAQAIEGDVSQLQPWVNALLEKTPPTHLYYFATPHITAQKNPELEPALYQSYVSIYVEDFERLITQLANKIPHTLQVFYPSTVFVDEQPKHFAEYTKAKAEGEKICESLNSKFTNIYITVSRLPRMKTDQTASLLPVHAKPALQEMQRVVVQMPNDEKSQEKHHGK